MKFNCREIPYGHRRRFVRLAQERSGQEGNVPRGGGETLLPLGPCAADRFDRRKHPGGFFEGGEKKKRSRGVRVRLDLQKNGGQLLRKTSKKKGMGCLQES